ncbi:hypothetical protein [Microbulbifer sp. Q7]|uniref:hypothetical protein n=1 Tax=Microbulbifer sp. Q7 TaxID=1785091 RepID=UPI00082AE68D|nr:hypothetical protein [Microbulbifer sp. Q7]
MQEQSHNSNARGLLLTQALFQLKTLKIPLLAVGCSTLGVLLLLYAIAQTNGIAIGTLTRDPTAVLKGEFYVGVLSNTGILLWSAAAAICVFSGSLLTRNPQALPWGQFLRASGAFTLLLLLDDLFLFHEEIAPHFLNIRERYILLSYATLMAIYLVRFWKIILRSEFILFGIAGGFFAMSVFIDKNSFSWLPDPFLLEDGAKFAGIVFWLFYFTRTSFRALNTVAAQAIDTEKDRPTEAKTLEAIP